MTRNKVLLIAGAAVILAGAAVLVVRNNPSTSTSDGRGTIGAPSPGVAVVQPQKSAVQVDDTSPFTHVALIPATVDPSTIRFERIKMVEVSSVMKTTTDKDCVNNAQKYIHPDGSNCQSSTPVARVKAIQATYSFDGPALAGDDSQSRSMFAVYFRPEELPVDGPVDKLKRDRAAALFDVSTSRPVVQAKGIDTQNSHYCAGNYVDGAWTQSDPKCHDDLKYVTKAVPAADWTVDIEVRHPVMAASR